MIIELNDVSDREMNNFLLRYVEDAKDVRGLDVNKAVYLINKTLSNVGVDLQVDHDEECDCTFIH
jgi:hypothetical protein